MYLKFKSYLSLFFIILIVGCSGISETETVDFYENGSTRIVHDYYSKEDSTFNEFWFNEDGKKLFVVQYVNGQRDGLMIRYYPSGARELLATYNDGKLEGEFTGWFEDGQVGRKRSYKNGVLLSLANYYPNGQIIGEVIVENGLIVEGIYYHQNGQIRSKGKFINEIKVGTWLQYDTLGNPTDTTNYDLTN